MIAPLVMLPEVIIITLLHSFLTFSYECVIFKNKIWIKLHVEFLCNLTFFSLIIP